MKEVICPWTKEVFVPERCDVFTSSIDGSVVTFKMKKGQCWCCVHGTGKEYKLEDLSSEHGDLVARVRDYFDL